MFAIEVQSVFSAAHALRLPAGGREPLHGHDFHVTVRLACEELDALETVVDFHEVQAILAGITTPWHNANLNEIEPFCERINPSAERIAQRIGESFQTALYEGKLEGAAGRAGRLNLVEVRVTEAAGCLAIWMPGNA